MYIYKHFIPENTAPKGAKRIGVYKGDERICTVPLGRLAPPTKEKLYSFGLVSDCHTFRSSTNFNGNAKLENALSYFNAQGCTMVIGCGDFTQTGFYRKNDSSTSSMTIGSDVLPVRAKVTIPPKGTYYDETQMYKYSEILKKSAIPVFEIFGNHENYNGVPITAETTIEGVVYNSLARAKELTGIPATAYTVSSSADTEEVTGTTVRPNRQVTGIGNDLFIFVGQSESAKPMSNDDLDWLAATLEANKDRRCFVFIHSFIDDDWGSSAGAREAEDADGYILSDSGNPCGARGNAIFGWWEDYAQTTLNKFLSIMQNAKNAVLFHGHSHMKFESQEHDECANYTAKNGFKSVHIPSLGSPRTLIPNDKGVYDGSWTTNKGPDGYTEPDTQCYVVDVYEDCIVLNGMDMMNKKQSILGTYKIVTK